MPSGAQSNSSPVSKPDGAYVIQFREWSLVSPARIGTNAASSAALSALIVSLDFTSMEYSTASIGTIPSVWAKVIGGRIDLS